MIGSRAVEDALRDDFLRFRRADDLAALARVFDASSPELFRVAVHLLGSQADAEDVVQTTFLAALESRFGYDEHQPFLPWLIGILIHRCHEARRAAGRVPDPRRLHREKAVDPSGEAERSELHATLKRAVASLPHPYRTVVAEHLFDERRAVEIARSSGSRSGTVRMQLSRGLDLLRRALPASLAGGGALSVSPTLLAGVRGRVLEAAQATRPSALTTWFHLRHGWRGLRGWVAASLVAGSVAGWALSSSEQTGREETATMVDESQRDGRELSTSVAGRVQREVSAVPFAASPPPGNSRPVRWGEGEVPRLLVADETGSPLPEAEVWFIPNVELDGEQLERDWRASGDHDEAFRRQALRYAVDADATVRLPVCLTGGHLMVLTPTRRYEQADLKVGRWGVAKPLRVPVDHPLGVVVLDEQGRRVAGVPIEAGATSEEYFGERSWTGGPDSVAWIRGAGQDPEGKNPSRVLEALRVKLAIPGVDEVVEAPLGAVCELALPPTGSLEVALRFADGNVVPDGMRMHLDFWRSEVARDGVVRFERVGLGSTWTAHMAGLSEIWQFRGPVESGETVRLERVLDDSNVWMQFDVGLSVARHARSVEVGWFQGSEDDRSAAKVEPSGAAFVALPRSLIRSSSEMVPVSLWHHGENKNQGVAQLEIARNAAFVNAGAVSWKRPDAGVTGRVVDERGQALPGVRICVAQPETRPNGRVVDARKWEADTVSDASGHFRVPRAALDEEAAVILTVDDGRVIANPHGDIAVGDCDVALEVSLAGAVIGSVRVPRGTPPGAVDVTVYADDHDGVEASAWLEPDGSFFVDGVAPGPSTLKVHVRGVDEPLAVRPVVVRAGVASRAAELEALPWDAALRPFQLGHDPAPGWTRRLVVRSPGEGREPHEAGFGDERDALAVVWQFSLEPVPVYFLRADSVDVEVATDGGGTNRLMRSVQPLSSL